MTALAPDASSRQVAPQAAKPAAAPENFDDRPDLIPLRGELGDTSLADAVSNSVESFRATKPDEPLSVIVVEGRKYYYDPLGDLNRTTTILI